MSPSRRNEKLLHSISGGDARSDMADEIQSRISQSDLRNTVSFPSSSPSSGNPLAHAVPVEDSAVPKDDLPSPCHEETMSNVEANTTTSTSADESNAENCAVIDAGDDVDVADDNTDEPMNEEDDDESEYDYDYEEDEDGHFQGFLEPCESEAFVNPKVATTAAHEITNPNLIENTDGNSGVADTSATIEVPNDDSNHAAVSEAVEDSTKEAAPKAKSTWEEPSKAAVSMSLRAEREKSGGKRRLASDLYKVMRGDTKEQGFTMEPQSEDSMDKWNIKLFGFDADSNLQKDLDVLGLTSVELEMSFPDDYPFAPPFVRVLRPRFKRQTGFVMNGALCMELLTSDGWNPVNDIESVIVSVRSLLVVGDGRLAAAAQLEETRGDARKKISPKAAAANKAEEESKPGEAAAVAAAAAAVAVAAGKNEGGWVDAEGAAPERPRKRNSGKISKEDIGGYSEAEALSAYSHLSEYHKKRGWDSTGWWARKG